MKILDGNSVAKQLKLKIKNEVEFLTNKIGKKPHLAAIIVGNDGASKTYVAAKEKDCLEIGFNSSIIRFEETISEEELLVEINKINNNPLINGLIVQLPLPKHINEKKVTETITWQKDVDGFHPYNVGLMFKNLPCYLPATPYGIIELLSHYQIETSGKNCVVIGRSDIVGKPMSALMLNKNCTVTVCHSKTQNLNYFTQNADILIVAVGIPNYVNASHIKPGAVVIDVGITRVTNNSEKGYELIGDVNFESAKELASYITPVPGGVGPMTRVGLLLNTLQAFKLNNNC